MPASPTRRQAQAAARREQLLLAAFERFSAHGYRATSVRDLAHALGVNEALLYHYFPSKAALFGEVLQRYAPFGPEAIASLPGPERSVEEVLRAEGAAFLALVRERRPFVATMLSEGPGDPELGQVLGAFLRGTRARIALALRERQSVGRLEPDAPVDAAARAFVGGLMFHFLSEHLFAGAEPSASDDRAVLDGLVEVVLAALRPTEGSGPSPSAHDSTPPV